MKKECMECSTSLEPDVYYHSLEKFGAPLCRCHQDWVRRMGSASYTVNLYFGLRKNGVPAKLEKPVGYQQSIDIAIPECKVNIEVDRAQQTSNPQQALADLQRTYFSFLNGYITLRIPNSLMECNIDETINYIIRFLNVNGEREWVRSW
ncbi:MAG: hypothetical protein ABIR18_08700 [Chitinophagaceae bacterium]